MKCLALAIAGGLVAVLTACSSNTPAVVTVTQPRPATATTTPSAVLANVGDQGANVKVCTAFGEQGQTFYADLYGHTDSVDVDPTQAYGDMATLRQLTDDASIDRSGTDLRTAVNRMREDAKTAADQLMAVASSGDSDDVGMWVQNGGLQDLTASFAAVTTACSAAGYAPNWAN